MAGGTYHNHADMEVLLGYGSGGLSSSTDPTDAEIDEITKVVEAVVSAKIRGQTGRSLADAYSASASETKGALMALSQKMFLANERAKARRTSSTGPDGTSQSSTAEMQWSPELRILVGLAAASGKVMETVSGVDKTRLRTS